DGDGRDELFLSLIRELDSMPFVRRFAVTDDRSVEEVALAGWYDASSSGRAVMAAGDVSGDGYVDLVIGGPNFGLGDEVGRAAVYLGDGAGDFAPALQILDYVYDPQIGHVIESITLAQVDGVGGLDMLTTNMINTWAGEPTPPPDFLLVATGLDGDSPQYVRTDLSHGVRAGTFADFTHDGLIDAALWSSQVYLAAGLEDLSFGEEALAFVQGTWAINPTMVADDFDGDGLLDLLVASDESSQEMLLAWGQEDGTLAEPLQLQTPDFESSLRGGTSGDLDSDGRPEMVAYGTWCGENVTQW
ncbi:MAG: VCBS repeat-containing protein, partial [Myxococcales bacterium]|nr:VCBS repeat-containing protein [Myxococcales bacterium]